MTSTHGGALANDGEYQTALVRAYQLMNAPAGSAAEKELVSLASLIEQYEEEHFPIELPKFLHGGSRRNSGRKPAKYPLHKIGVRLPPEKLRRLLSLLNRNTTRRGLQILAAIEDKGRTETR